MSTDRNDDKTAAAAWFTGILTLAAGGAGLVVAGLVLGLDYLLHGEPNEREALAERRAKNRRDRYADALAWLDAERADAVRARKAVRDWFAADPATRGARPSSGKTFGRIFGWWWNSTIVGASRFARGWKAGREEAQQRRTAGDDNWWRPNRNTWSDDEFQPEPTSTETREEADPQPHTDRPRTDRGPDSAEPDAEVIDAEIVPDTDLPDDREIVPVGDNPNDGPDPHLDEYGRRLDDLDQEVRQNHTRPAAQLN